MEEEKLKSNRGRKTLTDNQKKFCQLVVSGKEPLEAMLEVFPSRATYSIGNQRMLLKKMQEHPLIKKQLAEMFTELRESNVIGNAYDFNKGVALLNEEIQLAKKKIEEGNFSESIHRIILTSVQELNRMYGYNIVDRNGNTNNSVNITFVDVKQPEGVIIDASSKK